MLQEDKERKGATMTDNEFLCAELGIIKDSEIEAYNPSDFQREFLKMLSDGIIDEVDSYKLKLRLGEFADKHGMFPRDEKGGAIADETMLFTFEHIEMVISLWNTRIASLKQKLKAQNDPLQKMLRPAFELIQKGWKNATDYYREDLQRRWNEAGNACKWEGVYNISGRMVARTDSPIWTMLGCSELFDDGLNISFPPFFVNGGWLLYWETVTKKELEGIEERG